MGVGLCVPAMRYADDTLACRPLSSTGIAPLPRYYGPIRHPPPPRPAWDCLACDAPGAVTGPMVGSPGFRPLPVSACRRLRPRWTRVRSRLVERPLLPSPPLHTGRRPRCRGFRGLSRSLPRAFADFGPPNSCLRFVRDGHPPRRKTRSQQESGSLSRRWDFPRTHRCVSHPLGSAGLARRTQRPPLFFGDRGRLHSKRSSLPFTVQTKSGCSPSRGWNPARQSLAANVSSSRKFLA